MCTGGSQKRIDGPHSVKYSPEKWQLGAYVKIGYFETDADLLYQDEIHGSILEQIDKIVELVYLKYMRAKITYEGMQRIERYFVPE